MRKAYSLAYYLVLLGVVLAAASAQDHPDPSLDLPVTHPHDTIPEPPAPTVDPVDIPRTYPVSLKRGPIIVVQPPEDDPEGPKDEPPPVFFGEEIDGAGNNIVYVLDRSASMNLDGPNGPASVGGAGGTRWDSALREVRRSVEGLSRAFLFDIVVYNCEMQVCWSSLREATEDNKIAALEWLKQWQPRSGTGTGPGVCQAFALGSDSVVLLTDGEPTCPGNYTEEVGFYHQATWTENAVRDGHRRMIRNGNTQHAIVTVFGIEARNEYRAFCQNVAADNGGSYYDVR